jgi:hypothetical protein
MGENRRGVGVFARSGGGIALVAQGGDMALHAEGVASFSRSGTAIIRAGSSSVSMHRVRIDRNTLVLAVLQQNRPGVWVSSAVPDPEGNGFTIRLNMPVPVRTRVGWFLVN